MKYNILKEIKGEFVEIGETFEVESQTEAQKKVEALQAEFGGCYAAELIR